MIVKVVKVGINGEGIAYWNGKPLFIDGCFPNEAVDVEIIKQFPKYSLGKINRIVETSKNRIEATCPHYEDCGGCTFLTLDYQTQLKYKTQLLAEALKKYAQIDFKLDAIVASESQYAYRNKANLPLVTSLGGLQTALYKNGTNKPVVIKSCSIHSERLEEIRAKALELLNKYKCRDFNPKIKKGYRQLIIRSIGEQSQLVLVTGNNEIDKELVQELFEIPTIESVYQSVNTQKNLFNNAGSYKLLKGKEDIDFEIKDLSLSLSPKSFYQLNHQQAIKMYQIVVDMIREKVGIICEAYCGIGIMSMLLKDKANRIYAIELEKQAIEDGNRIAQKNHIENIEFICGDAKGELKKIKNIDVLVVDPPRKGLDDEIITTIITSDIKEVIYVSCNPATLAKNLKKLKEKYDIKQIIPVDMFPNTPLVECVMHLVRKGKK